MICTRACTERARALAALLAGATAILLLAPVAGFAAEAPVKEVIASHFGSEVDAVTKGGICTVESGHTCQFAVPSAGPGSFDSAQGVAIAKNGDIYVADENNNRIDELTPTGEFVQMFGADVNETTAGAVCTAEEVRTSGVKCKAGTIGAAPGQFDDPSSIAVDSNSGNFYVLDFFNWRVQELTPTGGFVLMIGKEVNETADLASGSNAEKNLCTAVSKDKCKAGMQSEPDSTEGGAFDFALQGGLLAVTSAGVLYVGDRHRVQEFAGGGYVRPISLESISSEPSSVITAITVDKAGDAYVVYSVNFDNKHIREFEPGGKEIANFPVLPRAAGAALELGGIALSPSGRLLAVTERENADSNSFHGSLYQVGVGLTRITEFSNSFGSAGSKSIASDGKGNLYAAGGDEVDAYTELPVAEPQAQPPECAPGSERETDVTIDCTLKGTVNPEGVAETVAWFQWGLPCPPGAQATTKQPVEKAQEVKQIVHGLIPDESYCDEVACEDGNDKSPEKPLNSNAEQFHTSAVAPRVLSEQTLLVGSSSAVLYGELNPEKSNTSYFFEYGPCGNLESCPGATRTAVLKSNAYGEIATTLEASGLQPSTSYHYRLVAIDEAEPALKGVGIEGGSFTTEPEPTPRASVVPPSGVGTSSAVISGAVDSRGQAATYAFELGTYTGASTLYSVVFSGSLPAGSEPTTESLGLSGLQPGTAYAYRISVKSAHGTAISGTMPFTTLPLPVSLSGAARLPMLAIPTIRFPTVREPPRPTTIKCKRGYKRDKRGKCVKAVARRSAKSRAKRGGGGTRVRRS